MDTSLKPLPVVYEPVLQPALNDTPEAVEQFEQGPVQFARMFRRWMDGNSWSHPVLSKLALCAMGGTGWLHSSQIAGLRAGTLRNPGPRTFVALAVFNQALHTYRTERRLIRGTSSSRDYANAVPILDENDNPPTLGWWVEVFCGFRVPSSEFVPEYTFTDVEARQFSHSFAKWVRGLALDNRVDLIGELNTMLDVNYAVPDPQRRQHLAAVLKGDRVWKGVELTYEIPKLLDFVKPLIGELTESELLKHVGTDAVCEL